MHTLGERIQLGLLCLLLLIMLGILAFTATNTFHAVQNFQQDYHAASTGDVQAIDPWMTLHTISHLYHVPEDYLYRSLNLGAPGSLRHVSLYDLARRKKQSVSVVIHSIQHAILAYRKQHQHVPTPQTTMPGPRRR